MPDHVGPEYALDFDNKKHSQIHDQVTQLVKVLVETNTKLTEAVTDKDQDFFKRKIGQAEGQIDELMIGFYGLSASQREVVEEAAS